MIVAHGLDAKQSDQHQLAPIADAIEANLGNKPTQLSADAGYCSTPTLRRWSNARSTPISRPGGPSTPGAFKTAINACFEHGRGHIYLDTGDTLNAPSC